jgi:hypothetical protein
MAKVVLRVLRKVDDIWCRSRGEMELEDRRCGVR